MPDTKHAIAALFPFGEQRDERQSELAAGKLSDRVEETRGFARPSILELCGLVVERRVYVSALEQSGERCMGRDWPSI